MPAAGRSLLVIADSLVGGIGGAVLSHCRSFADHGWSVTLAAPDAGSHAEDSLSVRDLAVPDGAVEIRNMWAAARKVRQLVRDGRPDVVHAHGLRSLAVVLASGHRAFVTLHSSDRPSGPSTMGAWLRDLFRDALPRFVPGAFSVVPLRRGRWVPVLIPSPRLPELASLPMEPGTPDPLFVFASRLSPPKRPDLFIDAIASLSQRVPRVRGVVLGEGPGRADLEAQIERTGAPVELLGRVDEMTDWYREAWAVCLFSDSEGLPFVVQEAMSAGRPLVTSPLPGIAWFAGDAVRYVGDASEAATAMRELCDPSARAAQGLAARARARAMLADQDVYHVLAGAYAVGEADRPEDVTESRDHSAS